VRQPKAWWIIFIVCALAGAILVLYATALGIGVSPDSTVYINVARSWLIRFGIPLVRGNTSNWVPPGYPMLLASSSLALMGQDPFLVARWLGAFLFALNIACVGLILHLALPNSFWTPLLGMGLMLTSISMLTIHTMAWTEPPFVFCSLVGLLALMRYLEQPRVRWLLLAAAFIAAGLLIRYVGIALAATAVISILVWSNQTHWQRIRAAATFAVLSCAPLVLWSLTHRSDRQLALHVMPPEWFLTAFPTLVNWFLPAELPLVPFGIALVTLLLITLVLFIALAKNQTQTTRVELPANPIPKIVSVSALYILFYALVFVTSKLVIDADLDLDLRTFAPLFPIVLIALLYITHRLLYSTPRQANLKITLGGIAVAWSVIYLLAGITWVEQTHREGQWYTSLAWQQSEIIQQVQALPPTTAIISNGNDAISFLTSRPATRLPDKIRGDSLLANPDYATDMQNISQRLSGDAVLVYLRGFDDRWFLPTEQELIQQWNLKPIARASDGTIYRRAP